MAPCRCRCRLLWRGTGGAGDRRGCRLLAGTLLCYSGNRRPATPPASLAGQRVGQFSRSSWGCAAVPRCSDHPGYGGWVPRPVVVRTRWARTYRASAGQDNSGQHGGTSLTSANSIGRHPTTFLNIHRVALAVWGQGFESLSSTIVMSRVIVDGCLGTSSAEALRHPMRPLQGVHTVHKAVARSARTARPTRRGEVDDPGGSGQGVGCD
jgi:hypothetical protein